MANEQLLSTATWQKPRGAGVVCAQVYACIGILTSFLSPPMENRMNSRHYSLTTATALLLACTSEPLLPPGTPGAGFNVQISGISPDSAGYKVMARATNGDTAVMAIGACAGSVEVLRDGMWKNLDPGGQCILVAIEIPPGGDYSFTRPAQAITRGEQVRFSLSWSQSYPRTFGVSTSAPVTVQ